MKLKIFKKIQKKLFKLDLYNNKNNILLLYMEDIEGPIPVETNILNNLSTIKVTLRENNNFLTDINASVEDLKVFIDKLIDI